jgi:hypothetical protein
MLMLAAAGGNKLTPGGLSAAICLSKKVKTSATEECKI